MELETLDICNVCLGRRLTVLDASADLCRCADCGHTFVNPRPTIRELIRYYSQPAKYDGWMDEEAARDALWRRRLKKMERTKKEGTLLDIGAGIGQFLHLAQTHYRAVYGTEVSGSAVRIAREKYGIRLFEGEIAQLPTDQTFDNISLFHVLEHVPDPRQVLEKCRSLLNDGGRLVIAVPNDLQSLTVKARAAFRRIKNALSIGPSGAAGRLGIPKIVLDGTVDEIHLSQFTSRSLRTLLAKTGFTPIAESLDPFYAKTGPALLLHHLYYGFQAAIHAVTGFNGYNTLWMAAEKGRGQQGQT